MGAATEPATVLVVDDDYGIRDVLHDVLDDAGYQVVTAGDGAAALDYLQQALVLPRVILLDLTMPIMTGWEFRMAQQNDPRLSVIPVVALSARASVTHIAYPVTMDAFLQKPIDFSQLLEVVERYCV